MLLKCEVWEVMKMFRSDWIFLWDENISYYEVRIIVIMYVFIVVIFYVGVGSEVRGMGFFVVFFVELFLLLLCWCFVVINCGYKFLWSFLWIRNIIKEKVVEGEWYGV